VCLSIVDLNMISHGKACRRFVAVAAKGGYPAGRTCSPDSHSFITPSSSPIEMAAPTSVAPLLSRKFPAQRPRKLKKQREAKAEVRPRVSPSTQVADAVNALRNSETRLTVEVKGMAGKLSTETKTTYPPELLKGMRSLFGSNREYLFELHNTSQQVTSGGGALAMFQSCSPAVESFSEWSALSALFDEVKLHSSRIEWLALGVYATQMSMMMAFDEQNLTSVPTSFLQVFRLAGSRGFHGVMCDNGSGRHTRKHKALPRTWCSVATPATQSPLGGMVGAWVYYNGNVGPASTVVALVNFVAVARLRCRA
jgi:hypothetical protein